ncbi:thyrotropin-releasing hormone receptor-like [Ornithorhynchus anatinus]|uniref:Thyrotropin-releasing hormone receptor n=1 Tax=Ornithorhynchus anatinus TaxID=9258 RepID=A0A6I8N0J9_ORNAN|nr:thyrotropin-releasing hormone receptor-like [Ornithorhynchus anatinus]
MENGTGDGPRAGPAGLPPPPLALQVVTIALVLLICGVGIAGNAMVVLVVARSRQMVTPTNCYLVSLAAADLLVLLAAGLPNISEVLAAWVFGQAGCLAITYLQYLGVNASTCSIAAFTVERYLAVRHPMRAQGPGTVARAKRVVALVWLATAGYCVVWLFLAATEEVAFADGVRLVCGYRVSRSLYLPIYFLDFALFYAVPLGLAAVLYGLIARILFLGPLAAAPDDPRRPGGAAASVHQGRGPLHRAGRTKGALTSRKQVTKMLAVVVILFALLWLPYRTLVVVNSFLNSPYLNIWFLLFCRLCIYLNSAINPIIYNLMSQKFRAAFQRLCGCEGGRRKRQPKTPARCDVPVLYSVMRDRSHHSSDHDLPPDLEGPNGCPKTAPAESRAFR